MWIKSLWHWVLQRLGIASKTITTDEQRSDNVDYTIEYQDITKINFTAIFAKKLAMLATSDSSFVLDTDNARKELLSDIGKRAWRTIRKSVSLALGCGGVILVPYVKNRKLYFDVVTQDRLSINEKDGAKITKASVIADMITINDTRYVRTVNYSVENTTLYITNHISTAEGKTATVKQWENIKDMAIAGVDRVPFGYIKCPADNRKCNEDYGVPVTYGCAPILEEIKTCLEQIANEYKLKKVKLQVDERAFKKDKDGNLVIKDDVFIAGYNVEANKNMFNIFDPAIRDSSFFARLNNLFEQLEKSVGTSKGVLTEPIGTYENIEAIRAANRDTWAMVTAIRESIKDAFDDFLYACNVYANYYNLSPIGDYDFRFDWDSSLIESTTVTWQHMKDLQTMGGMKVAEIRAWETGESPEDAQAIVDEIKVNEPNVKTLLGMGE